MAEFLSPAWIEELDGAAVAVDLDGGFALDQVVTGGPRGDVRYRLTVAGGRLHVRSTDERDTPADATITLGWATAVGLATGARNASDAFAAGLVRFRGNLAVVQAATAALSAAAATLDSLGRTTTYPTVGSAPAG